MRHWQMQGQFLVRVLARIPITLAALMMASLTGCSQQDGELVFFRIGTGSAGGTYFPIGGLIANAISTPSGMKCATDGKDAASKPATHDGPPDRASAKPGSAPCGVPGLVAIAQSTNASVHNVSAVNAGYLEAGLTGAATLFQAYHGQGKFKGLAKRNVRIIANLYPEHLHLVLPKGHKMQSLYDLRGKRVGIGQAGSGTQVAVMAILRAHNILRSDIAPAEINMSQSAERLADGHLDAFFYTGGTPIAALIQLASTKGLALYSFRPEEVRKINQVLPYYLPATIPANTYPGQEDDVQTVAVNGILITNKNLPAPLIYDITRALWSPRTRKLFDNGHAKAREIRLETALKGLAQLNVPLHPGAARYYREIGLLPQSVP